MTFVPPPAADPGKIGRIDVVAKATTFSGTTELGGVRVGAVVTLAKNFLGDVNGDQSVNSTDANIVLTREVGIAVPLQYPITCGDVNGDGKINSTDVLIILSFNAGFSVPYGIQKDPCK